MKYYPRGFPYSQILGQCRSRWQANQVGRTARTSNVGNAAEGSVYMGLLTSKSSVPELTDFFLPCRDGFFCPTLSCQSSLTSVTYF